MATTQGTTDSTEAATISRIIHPERNDWPHETAEALLRLSLDQSDLDRLHGLVVKNQDDALTPAEKAELGACPRIRVRNPQVLVIKQLASFEPN